MKITIPIRVAFVLVALMYGASDTPAQKKKPGRVPSRKPAVLAAPKISEVPFDETLLKSERLPMNFTGNSFDTVKMLIPPAVTAPKGEFESSEAYKRRLDNAGETVLSNAVKLNSLFAFRTTELVSKYDADAEALSVRLPVKQALLELFLSRLESSYRTILLSSDRQIVGRYIGQNAFGAQKEITKTEVRSRYFVLKNYSAFKEFFQQDPYGTGYSREFNPEFDSYRTNDFEFRVNLSPSVAERAKSEMAALLIVRLSDPYSGVSIHRTEPKMDYPQDVTDFQNYLVGEILQIWLFNKSTGEIYRKIIPTQVTSGTLEIRSPVRNGGLLILDKSMNEILVESGAEAVEKTGKSPRHDLFATLIMALARQNELKYKDFITRVLPRIQAHTVYTAPSELLGAKIKNVRFGEYYIFGIWNDSYNGTCVWDKPFSIRKEFTTVELNFTDATIKFDDGARQR